MSEPEIRDYGIPDDLLSIMSPEELKAQIDTIRRAAGSHRLMTLAEAGRAIDQATAREETRLAVLRGPAT